MKKSITTYVVAVFAILLVTIGVVQLLRLDYGHRLIPTEETQQKTFQTMSGKEGQMDGEPLQVYIHQDKGELSKSVLTNFKYALKYAKVPYTNISIKEIEQLEPSERTVLVLAGEHSRDWPYETIRQFVKDGGRLYIAARFINQDWAELVGVKQFGDFKDGINGLIFKEEIFPGFVDLPDSSNLFAHSIADVELLPQANVKITASGEPILWTSAYGKGTVLFWNTTSLAEKNSRGLMLQTLSLLFPSFVSQQAAIKVTHLDDFPSPVPGNTNAAIEKTYNRTIKEFFKEIWWRDMKRIADEQDVTYTGFIIGSYKNTTEETTEDLSEKIRTPMLNYGRGLLKMGGEIGLHGFNHQPLVVAGETLDPNLGYVPWNNRDQMEEALKKVIGTHDYYFPNESIQSYVPPSNIINETGLTALNNVFKDKLIVASLYSGDPSMGSYIQEFGPDPIHQNLYNFPRISSGYNETANDTFVMADAVANFGMFTHFIHPDDVLDEDRSKGKGWAEMEKTMEEMFRDVKTMYPYLESLTQYEAYEKYVQYQQSDINVTYTDKTIEINGTNMLKPSVMLVRVAPGQHLKTGTFDFGTVRALAGETLYQVTLTKATVTLPIEEGTE
ncbi:MULTISPECIES: DUF2194 domain-containing protein [unclassified Exiguobacterium]|uniref:DUF2194 domain-containing protein n=1 Tax=unclassified Exiguobacterium TaxID=2644629 RepID=UPI001BEB1F2B|nr:MULTISPECIES: DUF2194 domain-containing protein [unclassified Exiguobacterium]